MRIPTGDDAALAAVTNARSWSDPALCAVLLVALVVFLFADLASLPMLMWDEARQAVNAAEMVISGDHLITTYGFVPDLWNTKPPLLVNLIALSLQLFGFNTFALRCVSALAGCITVVIVAAFVRRESGSLATGLAAAALLTASSGFYGFHAAATGDFDALLTLWTTAYSFALFAWLESPRERPRLARAIGVAIGLAVLTKGIAGLIPLTGIGVYTLLFARARLRAGIAGLCLMAAAAAFGGGYYLLRGAGHPGYLAVVAANEVGGRFSVAQEGCGGSPWYYLGILFETGTGIWPMFSAAAITLLAVPALWLLNGRKRRLVLFALCHATALVVVYSAAATKQFWYIVPALPMLAVALALAADGLLAASARLGPRGGRVLPPLFAAGLAMLVAEALLGRYLVVTPMVPAPRAFDRLIAAAAAVQALPLAVLDHGYPNHAGFHDYAATLRFYMLDAARRGEPVFQVTSTAAAASQRYIGGCDPATYATVAGLGVQRWAGNGCVLVERPHFWPAGGKQTVRIGGVPPPK